MTAMERVSLALTQNLDISQIVLTENFAYNITEERLQEYLDMRKVLMLRTKSDCGALRFSTRA